eukprot:m.102766 g.102766  ORF g.102766 m.102766 type:complete len:335 (+) comp15196_c1_seq2:69-1073(+)
MSNDLVASFAGATSTTANVESQVTNDLTVNSLAEHHINAIDNDNLLSQVTPEQPPSQANLGARALETKTAVMAHLDHASVREGLRHRPLKAALRSSAVQAITNGKTFPMGQWVGASKERSFWLCAACHALNPEVTPSQMKRFQHLGASIRRYLTRSKPVLCPWLHLGENITMLVLPTQPPIHHPGTVGVSDAVVPTLNGAKRNRFSRGDAASFNLFTGLGAPPSSLPPAGLTSSSLPLYGATSSSATSVPAPLVPTMVALTGSAHTTQGYIDVILSLQQQLTDISAKRAGFRSLIDKLDTQEAQLLAQMAVYAQRLKAETASYSLPPTNAKPQS